MHVPISTVFYVREAKDRGSVTNLLLSVSLVYNQVPVSLMNLSLHEQSRGITYKSPRLWVQW